MAKPYTFSKVVDLPFEAAIAATIEAPGTHGLSDIDVHLNAFETGEARAGIGRWIGYYNTSCPHSSFGGRTPDEVYAIDSKQEKLAA